MKGNKCNKHMSIENILSEEMTGQDLKDKEAAVWQAGGKTLQAGEHK